jgi:hypothetical protein
VRPWGIDYELLKGWERMLNEGRKKVHAYQMLDRSMAEPITAIITIPIAFVGPYSGKSHG